MPDERDDPLIDEEPTPERAEGPKRRRLFRLLVLALSAGLVLIAFEAIYRLERTNKLWESLLIREASMIHAASPDSILSYDLKPNSTTLYMGAGLLGGVQCVINSLGMRDDEPPREIADDTPRIVVLGDSVAFGHRVAMESAFPQLLERRLGEVDPDAPAPIVYNMAVTGYSLAQSVRKFELQGEALKPSLVILSYVLNDPDTAPNSLSLYFHRPRSEVLNRLSSSIRRFSRRSRADEEYHQFIHRVYARELKTNFERLAESARRLDIPVVVVITPLFIPREEPYRWTNLHRQIADLAEGVGFDVIDMLEPIRNHPERELGFDIWHPKEQGHQLISDALFEYLRKRDQERPVESSAIPGR